MATSETAGDRLVGAGSRSSYEEALRDRLQRIQLELETHGSSAIATRKLVETTRQEAEENARELSRLREKWIADQPQREALLKETGEAERRLAERERRLADQLAAQAAGDPVPARSARGGSSSSGATTEKSSQLQEHRQCLAKMEEQRQKLTSALKELREATREETAEVVQLKDRTEVLRKESRSLRAGAEAARENEARVGRKLEAVEITAAAAQQRHHAMERHIAELQDEVHGLREELASATAVPPAAAATLVQQPRINAEETWAMNRRLEAKVASLREELRNKQDIVQRLRQTSAGATADDRGAAAAEEEVSPEPEAEAENTACELQAKN